MIASLLLALQPAPPGDGGPIIGHPLANFLDVFGSVCLTHAGNLERQRAAVSDRRTGFQPELGSSGRFHRRSVSVSIRMRAARDECTVSGLVLDHTALDAAIPAVAERFALGEPQFGRSAGTEMAVWGHGQASPRTITLSVSPVQMGREEGSPAGRPAHLVVTISTPTTETP